MDYQVGRGEAGKSAEYYAGYQHGFSGADHGGSDRFGVDYMSGYYDGNADHYDR